MLENGHYNSAGINNCQDKNMFLAVCRKYVYTGVENIKERKVAMNKRNYQKELDQILTENQKEEKIPVLLLHSCCAPCSSYVLEYLSDYFDITIYYYNPNISSKSEYEKRVSEQKRLINEMKTKNKVMFIEGEYNPELFFEISKGLEDAPEGGERCFKCYRQRLEKTADFAKKNGFDYFTTTLSISPHKHADKINEIGIDLEIINNIKYLKADFKKKNGYKRSIELSKEYNLYRQNFCGCVFSKRNCTP